MANLPPIPEMIMTAIEMKHEADGSTKSTIEHHIKSNYSSLPVDFSDLLTTHLAELTTVGQLILVNGCYKKADSDSDADATPPRRGRGRPPKAKTAASPLSSGYVVSSPRPRGRPPKPVDPLAPSPPVKVASTGGSGRKRGRPAKAGSVPKKAVVLSPNGEPRGRGRPPKVVKTPVVAEIDIEA